MTTPGLEGQSHAFAERIYRSGSCPPPAERPGGGEEYRRRFRENFRATGRLAGENRRVLEKVRKDMEFLLSESRVSLQEDRFCLGVL